ncbi:MAG: class I SAM-dependent methyltransferase [Prosthecobacter sp.]
MNVPLENLTEAEQSTHQRLFESLIRDRSLLGGAVRPPELDLLARVYKTIRPARSLEWGLGTGVSAAALGLMRQGLGLEGCHRTLDPFQEKFCDNQGLKCLAEFRTEDCVTFQPLTAEEFLIQARNQKVSYNFIFIDGWHGTGNKLMDACLAESVLAPGGVIAFHDSFIKPTSLALQFLKEEQGMRLLETGTENRLKRRLRALKHAHRLGFKYSLHYAPKIDYSLSFLVKEH